MGELIAVFKIMPESVESDLDALQEQAKDVIPEGVSWESVEIKPVAFGLKAIHVTLRMEDTEDISVDGIEDAFAEIKGVESVSCEDVGRL